MVTVDDGKADLACGNLGDKPALIYATFPTVPLAEETADRLLCMRVIACANIFPTMTAIYHWQGQRQRHSEVAVLFKTRIACRDQVIAAIAAHHPYDNPAIVALDCADAAAAFAAWIVAETTPVKSKSSP